MPHSEPHAGAHTPPSPALPAHPAPSATAGAGRSVGSPRPTGPGWARRALAWVAWAFVLALLAQVFTAGMAVFVNPGWWAHHRSFVHAFEWMPLLALGLALRARAPRAIVALAGSLLLLIAVQYTTAHLRLAPGTQLLAALHPVSAVLLVGTASELARRVAAWRTLAGSGRAPAVRTDVPAGAPPPPRSLTPIWPATSATPQGR